MYINSTLDCDRGDGQLGLFCWVIRVNDRISVSPVVPPRVVGVRFMYGSTRENEATSAQVSRQTERLAGWRGRDG